MIKTLSISLLLAIGLIFSGYLIGSNLQPEVYNLETIKTEPVIQKEIYWQTETVEIYPELREFESKEELVSWLSGKQVWNKDWNCVDYSYDLQMKAQNDGYYMTLWTLTPDQYDWWFGTENIEYWWGAGVTHMVCGVIINDQVYLIDASASLKIYPEED
jgi:hypothetical protein